MRLHQQSLPLVPVQFDRHRSANVISWVISPVVVAPLAYLCIVMFGYRDDAARLAISPSSFLRAFWLQCSSFTG